MKETQWGYTIVELVVTLAIASILTTLAVYNFVDSIPHQQLKEAGQNLVGQLRLARQIAIANGENATLSFRPSQKQYDHPILGKQVLPNHVWFGTPVGVRKAPNEGSTIPKDGISFNDDKATFQPDGTIAGFGGTVYLHNTKEAVAIRVNVTGRVKLSRWNGNDWE